MTDRTMRQVMRFNKHELSDLLQGLRDTRWRRGETDERFDRLFQKVFNAKDTLDKFEEWIIEGKIYEEPE